MTCCTVDIGALITQGNSVRLDGTQLLASNVPSMLQLPSVSYVSGVDTSITNRLKIITAGIYSVIARIYFTAPTVTTIPETRSIEIRRINAVTGDERVAIDTERASSFIEGSSPSEIAIDVSTLVVLNKGDILYAIAVQISNQTLRVEYAELSLQFNGYNI